MYRMGGVAGDLVLFQISGHCQLCMGEKHKTEATYLHALCLEQEGTLRCGHFDLFACHHK
jgi:hypothetical protein